MKNFNYNNYIGDHMSEPLKIELSYSFTDKKYNSELTIQTLVDFEENDSQEYCKPLIKSPADLTDDEWLFVLIGDTETNHTIKRTTDFINLVDISGNVWNYYHFDSKRINFCRQDQLNRLYSLHCHPNHDELIRTEKAVRKP